MQLGVNCEALGVSHEACRLRASEEPGLRGRAKGGEGDGVEDMIVGRMSDGCPSGKAGRRAGRDVRRRWDQHRLWWELDVVGDDEDTLTPAPSTSGTTTTTTSTAVPPS